MPAKTVPPWLPIALLELGTAELSPGINQRIVQYHSATALQATDDAVPWCASFVNWCLLQAGVRGSNSAAARDFLKWGQTSGDRPALGDIAVLSRESSTNPRAAHAGFVLDCYGGILYLINGNIGNRVAISQFGLSRLLGYRRP